MRYRHLRRTFIAALVGVAVLAGVLVAAQRAVETAPARRLLVLRLERWLGDATGGDVTVGSARLSLVPLRLELKRVRVAFPGWALGVRRLVVAGLRLRPARARLDLGLVAAEGVRIRAAETPPLRHRRQGRSWLRVHVRQLQLDDVRVEDLKLPGRIGLSAGPVRMAWTSAGGPPRGFLRVGSFTLRVPGLRPVTGSMAARLRAEEGLEAPHLVLETNLLRARGRGAARSGGVWLALHGSADLAAADRVLRLGDILEGRAMLDVRVDTQASPVLRGRVSVPRLRAAGFPVREVAGVVSVGGDGVRGRLERAVFHGGRLRGTYRLTRLGDPWPHQVVVHGEGISLAGFLEDLQVPGVGLAGAADVDLSLRWRGSRIRAGEGEGEARLRPLPGALPVHGVVRARLAPPGLIQFDGRDLGVGATRVDWQGPLTLGDWVPSWSISAVSGGLGELVPVVNGWVGSEVLPSELGGAGAVHLVLSGPFRNPAVSLEAELAPVRLPPLELDRAVVSAEIAGGRLDLERGVFRVGGGGGRAEGTIRWDRPRQQLDLHLSGQDIPLARIGAWLDAPVELQGRAGFSGTLRGSVARPAGSFALGLAGVGVAGIPLGDGSARVELAEGTFTTRALRFSRGLEGEASWQVTGRRVTARLGWKGLELDRVHPAVRLLAGPTGDVSLDLDWPLDGVARLDGRIVSSRAALRMHLGREGITVGARLGRAAEAELNLERTGDGLHGTGGVRVHRAGDLLERLLPGRGLPLTGSAAASLEVDWPRGGEPRVRGRLERAELELEGRPVRLLEPATVVAGPEGVRLEGLHGTVGQDELFLRLARGADGSLSGNLSGTLDALLLRLVLPRWEPAGRVEGVVELLGTVARPRLEGLVRVEQGSFRLPGTTLVFGSIGGTAELGDGQATLGEMNLRVMGGRATCSGVVRPGARGLELDLAGSARGVRYTVLPGLEARLSGSWWLRGPVADLELGGRLVVDHASLRRREDVAAILMDWFGPEARSAGGSEQPRLALHVEADRSIEARTPFIHLAASAELDIGGTPAHPGVVGRIELLEGGDLILRGVRYELDRGIITFIDPTSIEPRIDLQARAWVDLYTVTVILQGTPERIVPTLTSEPPLQEADILSLLSLGHRTGREDEGMGAVLASSILTSQINAELERRARSILAVDQLRVDPFSESTTGNPTARVTVVKQLAPNWTVVVQSNLSSNREEVVISRWYLSPGLFLEATRDTDGSYSLDVKLRRRY